MTAKQFRPALCQQMRIRPSGKANSGLLLWLFLVLQNNILIAAQSSSTTCNIDQDTCATQQNDLCESGDDIFFTCPPNTDCFDCDEFRSLNLFRCQDCIDQGGRFCWRGPLEPSSPMIAAQSYCSAPEIAQAYPNACFDQTGGSAYYDTCESTPADNIQEFLQVCNINDSSCIYQYNGLCDAGADCAPNTDCFDCQDLMEFSDDCEVCINDEGGVYCYKNPNSFDPNSNPGGFCSAPELASLYPNACIDSEFGGGAFLEECIDDGGGGGGPSAPASQPASAPAQAGGDDDDDDDDDFDDDDDDDDNGNTTIDPEIQNFLDTCNFNDTQLCPDRRQDGFCDAGGLCPASTDCLDCDPMQKQRFLGCQSCIQNQGHWCFQYGANETATDIYVPTTYGFCNLPQVAAMYPAACLDSEFGGTEYFSNLEDCGPVSYESVALEDENYDTPFEAFTALCQRNDTTCGSKRQGDGICDAGSQCLPFTDCVDCSPFMEYRDNCYTCVLHGGHHCTIPQEFGPPVSICSSPDIVQEFPDVCNYTTTCDPPSCDFANDPCPHQLDGFCHANYYGVSNCTLGSDCFDCQDCAALRYFGCDACTQFGCVWCGADSLCLDPQSPLLLSYTCTAADLVDSCPGVDTNPYSDPTFDAGNWVFEMINVKSVWAMGYTGAGIKVLINDDGLDITHPEIAPNYDPENSCDVYFPADPIAWNTHGTSVASIGFGAGNNGVCGVGIAPNASISSCAILNPNFPEDDDFHYYHHPDLTVDISQNSHGTQPCTSLEATSRRRRFLSMGADNATCPFNPAALLSPCASGTVCEGENWNEDVSEFCEDEIILYCRLNFEEDPRACGAYLELYVECYFQAEPRDQVDAFIRGVQEGRDGKGIVYVFSAGNDYAQGSLVNYEPSAQSRFTISVGAVGRDGKHASYSEPGSALFLSAPGGDRETATNHVTAKSGSSGCHEAGIGTSFSAPVVSGVVALMLEANYNLTWRDVQGILAITSQMIDPDHESWTTNGANVSHSYLYGFGVVDAEAAVEAAVSWENWGSELNFVARENNISLAISDANEGEHLEALLEIDAPDDIVAESAVVYLDIQHASRGDLEITLISPNGTESVLTPGNRPENQQHSIRWKLMTLRNWGERIAGNWSIRIADKAEGDLEECADSKWSVFFLDDFVDCYVLEINGLCNYGQPISNETLDSLDTTIEQIETLLTSSDFQDSSTGLGPYESCCACEGGKNSSTVEDLLISWRLQVFGHSLTNDSYIQPDPLSPTSPTSPETPSSPVAEETPSPQSNSPVEPTSPESPFSPVTEETSSPQSNSPVLRQPTGTPAGAPTGAPTINRLSIPTDTRTVPPSSSRTPSLPPSVSSNASFSRRADAGTMLSIIFLATGIALVLLG